MESLTSRVNQVYIELGTVLDKPESFGLGRRVPKPLLHALTAMREKLKEEMVELKRWKPDDLPAELSQDTDTRSVSQHSMQHGS